LVVSACVPPACIATVSVADCDDTACFHQIPCDVSSVTAYDVNSAGNSGRTPAEVRDGLFAARDRPAIEPRARFPLARGQPVRMASRVRGKVELVVEHVDGRAHLPIVSLRQAA
jgi:hypothetical protein